MAYFAKVEDGIVTEVIVAEQEIVNSGIFGTGWIQTSYNTYGGKHNLSGVPLRKNFAGVGFTYDSNRDAFIPPKRYESWILNEKTCLWEPPIPYPEDTSRADGRSDVYIWNEAIVNWEKVSEEE